MPRPSESSSRRPPSVDRLVAAVPDEAAAARDRGAVVAAAREVVAVERRRLAASLRAEARQLSELASDVAAALDAHDEAWSGGAIGVINATGVLIHTNLGRTTWPQAAIEAARAAAESPLLLELDAETGKRGRRYRAAEDALIELTGAEDALVTNNNAAAVALAVGLAGRGGGVVVSRGELVEIGGGVRIPEIIRRAGARLIEVGTTNRTRAADFQEPLAEGRAKLVLRVHRSNFRQDGFVEDPDLEVVADLAHRHGAVVVDDLGSGALLDTAHLGLPHEPQPAERLAAGADLVTFSGDKLVGGPQAGLMVGRADLVARVRRDPLARAMRPDKVTLAAVAATLGLYRSGRATAEVPLWRAVAAPLADLQARAARVAAAVGGTAIPTDATFGGGALPGAVVPSRGVALTGRKPDALAAALRSGGPPVVGRIDRDRLILDLRTVEPDRDEALVAAIQRALDQAR
ncbi:MAG TPA: L-seryl-tRNA(Sec) selenium transferase [Candidatus Limnocylindrales bacterium]|nr:L-seryl-tRNA(Sec) selenium transferase [Candidatus Limnocylindrales bacterium]